MVEYWYITEEQHKEIGNDYGKWLNVNPTKGKVSFQSLQELKEGFSIHYPGCKLFKATCYS